MSSFIGHILIGSSIAAGNRKTDSSKTAVMWMYFVGLAVSPDIDYIILWVFNYRIDPRYTHSIGFCFFVGLLAWGFKTVFLKNLMAGIPFRMLFAAPLSHLVLDLLVGAHPMPLFWPVDHAQVVLPFGVLPSAASMNISNIYFWRNLILEIGILLPVSILIAPEFRSKLLKGNRFPAFFVLCVFIASVAIGVNLKR